MIASNTAYVPHDPPSVQLMPPELNDYVGTYELAPGLTVSIRLSGDKLVSSTNGAKGTLLAFEARDVAFSPGGGNGRRLFLRGPAGRVVADLSSRDGTDLRINRSKSSCGDCTRRAHAHADADGPPRVGA